MIPFPIITLFAVFFLIAVRQVGRFRFDIWEAMLLGALAGDSTIAGNFSFLGAASNVIIVQNAERRN